MLCTRAETLLQRCAESRDERPLKTSLTGREKKIIALARTGRRTDEIAGSLALAREEVELVLGLEKKFARLGNEKVRS
jgi:DNA-binding NarL/FixJ family response regulator